jgi:hypothetical protein
MTWAPHGFSWTPVHGPSGCFALYARVRVRSWSYRAPFFVSGADMTKEVRVNSVERMTLLAAAGSTLAGPEVINLLLDRGVDPNKQEPSRTPTTTL